jgi:hypothetical protein
MFNPSGLFGGRFLFESPEGGDDLDELGITIRYRCKKVQLTLALSLEMDQI